MTFFLFFVILGCELIFAPYIKPMLMAGFFVCQSSSVAGVYLRGEGATGAIC